VLLDEEEDGEVAFSKATIAALLRTRRQSVNRVLRELGRHGAIDAGYRSIAILDRSLLAVVAGGRQLERSASAAPRSPDQ